MKKYKYNCSFNGRLSGALGITYKVVDVVVIAETEKQALIECYKTYEHISNFKCKKVES